MMAETLKEKLTRIKLIVVDVDGVLTDGTIYVGTDGQELKRFSVVDGVGLAFTRVLGIRIALISGRYSPATEQRARELNIDDVYNGTLNKLLPYEELKQKYNLTDAEIAFIGDDIIDIPVMKKVGVPIAVDNAYAPVKEVAVFITQAKGGEGALREAIEWIVKGQGRYDETLAILQERVLNTVPD